MYAVNFSDLYVSFINANVIIGSSLFFIIYLFSYISFLCFT